jgi:Spy/CpxP family protein refolding chaperone
MLARIVLTATLAATLTATFASRPAFAQRGGGGMGGEGGMGEGGAGGGGMGSSGMGSSGMGRVQRQSKLDIIAEKLKLNKDQKDQVQTIFLAAMEESRPIGEQIMRGREAIAGAMITGKSEDDIKKMLDQYAELAAQMTGVETKAFAKVYAVLKPNQQQKAPAAFEIMAGMFGAQMGGGRGRGRG